MIPLQAVNGIVGRNNAGKSTVIEALRLVSTVANRYRGLNYAQAPPWTPVPKSVRGVSPSIGGMEINFDSAFHRYSDPPSIITATFSTGNVIDVYVGPERRIFATVKDEDGRIIDGRSLARQVPLPTINTLPQVGPVRHEEFMLGQSYVRSNLSSSLAPLHFRNQLHLLRDSYVDFKELAERTWPGLEIRELVHDAPGSAPDLRLFMYVRDGDFVAEVGSVGHGLQMWLQTMWFLARASSDSTVILDEPDVYMHADLQRRLIRLVKDRYHQVVIATHSIEIMYELRPEQILVIDRSLPESRFANSLPGVQNIIDHIGGVQNIQLARLWSNKKCLFVEGKDVDLLSCFHDRLYASSHEPIAALPHIAIGGRGGWNIVLGSRQFLRRAGGEEIIVYCILDRDYYPQEEVAKRMKEATENGMQLHIWRRKEIENYLVVPAAIQRVIASRCKTPPSVEDIGERVDEVIESLLDETHDNIASQLQAMDRRLDVVTVNSRARSIVSASWDSRENRLGIVSGKAIMSALSTWSNEQFSASFSNVRVAQELLSHEIDSEVVGVITAIDKSEPFS
jgi:energy-coupling factor transporter ATP-binding protein EcfA2